MLVIMGKSILFLCVSLLNLLSLSHSRFLFHRCPDNVNYTTNGTYERNLDIAVSSFTSNITTIINGFYSQSVGQTPDRVNVIALCRGDVEPGVCRSCINEAKSVAKNNCPNQTGAVVWYDDCMLRFSNRTFLGTVNTQDSGYIWNIDNFQDVDQLYGALRPLMERLRNEAAAGGSLRKFASNDTPGPGFMTLYGLMQCTPDLSETQCRDCLEAATNAIPGCCNASLDVRILFPSCNVRYANSLFYNNTVALTPPPSEPPALPPPPPPPPPGKNSDTTLTLVIVIVSVVGLVILIPCVCIFAKRRMLRRRSQQDLDGGRDETVTAESLQYNFDIIKAATNEFSENNKLGQGGFGSVYKGKLQNGQEIAVKRLSRNSGQGEREFKNEVLLMARLQHRNLVRLIGFSLKGPERLLMYEFLPNTSLDHFLFDPMKRATLDWQRRHEIIRGVARGLLYLHEDSRLRIIHRDIKASNVLLDDGMNPKIADFGMAKLFAPEESQANTNRIVGTYGYMAPEYAIHGKFSVKSDVFSFGVLVLEIITGQKNHSFRNVGEVVEDLLSYAWKRWKEGAISSIVDPSLRATSVSLRYMTRCIHIGLLCVQENVDKRPTMASIILMLDSFSLTLPIPSEPAFLVHSSIGPERPPVQEFTSRPSQWTVATDASSDLYPR